MYSYDFLMQEQTALTAYFTSKQLMLFAFTAVQRPPPRRAMTSRMSGE